VEREVKGNVFDEINHVRL